jgi:hypothetical protein
VLTAGVVSSIEWETGQGNWSTSAKLRVQYSEDARGSLPERLFLKMVDTDIGDDETLGGSEVDYYGRDYVDVPGAPLLRCYHAAYSARMHRYHILLDDVSDTHVQAADKEPTLEYGLALAEGLAVIHAHWWGALRLAEAAAPIHSADHIRRFAAIAEPGAGHIINGLPAALRPTWPDAIRALFARHPQAMIDRTKDANGFTLIHGDVGHRNVLVPREGDRPLFIIDRQPFDWSLTTWLGVYDLAYAMVLDWPVEARRRHEVAILERYHTELRDRGVNNYTWDQLFYDYRLCVPTGVYVATEFCRGGLNERWASVWLPMLQRSLTASDDLACDELW